MDQVVTNSQSPGICHRLLFSALPAYCSVCKALAISSRLFDFRASAAPSLAAQSLLLRCWEGLLDLGVSILQRIHDAIMRILVPQATKPVTLGSFKDYAPVEMPDFHVSQSTNGIVTMNDQNTQLAPHEDPSAEKDYKTSTDENQAQRVNDSASMLTESASSFDYPEDEREISEVKTSADDDVHSSRSVVQEKGDEEEEQEKVPTPNVIQKAKAPKKMVSINENVEIFPTSKKKRMTSRQWSLEIESQGEESKPLKSILKVGSKLNNE